MKSKTIRRIGHKIKTLREEKELSQERLAGLSGLHRTYISGLERGVRNPTITSLTKIARALGVPLDDLVKQ